jgi:glycosidase
MPRTNFYYPSLYQINTRLWLRSLSTQMGVKITLNEVPDDELDRLARLGFDWVWLLGVWRTGESGFKIAHEDPDLRREYLTALSDLQENDICSSPFAITAYSVSPDLGGNHELELLRERLRERGLKLLLDFIPNHTARDHPWLILHPDYYVQGSEDQLLWQPFNFGYGPKDEKIFAFGRDPYFPGWSDTFQLNYGNSQLQNAVRKELVKVADLCDGVRCDMAMLILPEVFMRTWGIEMQPFWDKTIDHIRAIRSDFTFMAEVYWDLEWILQEQGFDYTYDKRLYDRLLQQEARPVREHLFAGLDFQNRSARFLENHDEPRAAASFPDQVHQAAAIITYLTPGLRFFHQGQLEGLKVHIPMQLCRAPEEDQDDQISALYHQLLELLKFKVLRTGSWQLLECLPAWQSNWTWDSFVAFSWQDDEGKWLLVVINYSPYQSQCYVRVPSGNLAGRQVVFQDKLSQAEYTRNGDDIHQFGLYLDMPAWGTHIFEINKI